MRKSMSQNTAPLLLQHMFHRVDAPTSEKIAAATAAAVLAAMRDAARPQPGCRILLHGDLGAGKTTWVRAFLRACGITGRVKSPSFSIVESYETPLDFGGLHIHHLDFYRQDNPTAWQAAGLRDLMTERAIVLIEWPERAQGLPEPHIEIWISWPDEVSGDAPRDLKIIFHHQPTGFDPAPYLNTWTADVDKP